MTRRTVSGSVRSASAVDPTTSENTSVTCFRDSFGSATCSSAAPQARQKRASSGCSFPQLEQTSATLLIVEAGKAGLYFIRGGNSRFPLELPPLKSVVESVASPGRGPTRRSRKARSPWRGSQGGTVGSHLNGGTCRLSRRVPYSVPQHADPLDLQLDLVARPQPAAVVVVEDRAASDRARA